MLATPLACCSTSYATAAHHHGHAPHDPRSRHGDGRGSLHAHLVADPTIRPPAVSRVEGYVKPLLRDSPLSQANPTVAFGFGNEQLQCCTPPPAPADTLEVLRAGWAPIGAIVTERAVPCCAARSSTPSTTSRCACVRAACAPRDAAQKRGPPPSSPCGHHLLAAQVFINVNFFNPVANINPEWRGE